VHTQLVITDKPFSSTAMGAAIHSSEEVRLHDILGRTFGVVRLSEHGRREYFCPIFPAGLTLPKPGSPPLQHSVTYSPQHNIGHLRYLECSVVDSQGRPAEGVRPWSEAVFPYDPAIPVGKDLVAEGHRAPTRPHRQAGPGNLFLRPRRCDHGAHPALLRRPILGLRIFRP